MAYDRTIPGAVSPEQAQRMRDWAQRKPRVALMGEFSAGKSTLLNFLIEENLIPTRATATEVPPLWFSHGENDAYWVDAEGERHPLKVEQLGSVPMSARYVRVFSKAEILEHCDIVDTPGISDPNLAVESWRFAAGIANMVLWCSSATQAWRETERSTWLSLPERLRKHSVLIVTRADKLVAEGDRDKVQRRLARETAGLFSDRVFMATPDAVRAKAELAEGESSPLWESSGAAALLDRLAEQFEAIYAERAALLRQRLTGSAEPVEPAPEAVEAVPEPEAPAEPAGPMPTRPVRVQPGGPRRAERLRPEDAEARVSQLRSDTPSPVSAAAALSGAEPEAPAEVEPAAVEEDFFGADDDKDDRAFRDALGLDEPVTAPETPEAFAGAESGDFGEQVAEELEAAGDAEPGIAMWETTEAPEAEAEEQEPFGAAEETEAGAEAVEAVADAEPEQDEAALPEDVAGPELAEAGEEEAAVAAEEPEAEAPVAPVAKAWEPERIAAAAEEVPGPEAQAEAEAPAEVAATAEEPVDPVAKAWEPEQIAAEAEEVSAPEAQAEAEAPAEGAATAEMPDEAEAAEQRPYLLDARHSVAAGQTQAAALPPAVQVWRGIVARTALLPGNAQIAAMIEELLMALEAGEPAPEAAAAEPVAETAAAGDAAEPEAVIAAEAVDSHAETAVGAGAAETEAASEDAEPVEAEAAEEAPEAGLAEADSEAPEAQEAAESEAALEAGRTEAEAQADDAGDATGSESDPGPLSGWRRLA